MSSDPILLKGNVWPRSNVRITWRVCVGRFKTVSRIRFSGPDIRSPLELKEYSFWMKMEQFFPQKNK